MCQRSTSSWSVRTHSCTVPAPRFERARAAGAGVLALQAPPGTSPGSARNHGVAAARGQMVWLLDERARISAASLLAHATASRATHSIVQGPCDVPSPTPRWSTAVVVHPPRRPPRRTEGSTARDVTAPSPTRLAPLDVMHAHPFDELYRTEAFADVDLAARQPRRDRSLRLTLARVWTWSHRHSHRARSPRARIGLASSAGTPTPPRRSSAGRRAGSSGRFAAPPLAGPPPGCSLRWRSRSSVSPQSHR